MPVLEVKARRVVLTTMLFIRTSYNLGLRWIVSYARLRGEHTMEERLAKEQHNTGASVKNAKTLTNGRSQPCICTIVGNILLQHLFVDEGIA